MDKTGIKLSVIIIGIGIIFAIIIPSIMPTRKPYKPTKLKDHAEMDSSYFINLKRDTL